MGYETKNHATAKARLKRWLQRHFPESRVITEYPLCVRRGELLLWHDRDYFQTRTPAIRELRNMGIDARYRLDVCLAEPGKIVAGFEVCHSFGPSTSKERFLEKMEFETVEMDANWINRNKGKVPDAWQDGVMRVYGPKPWAKYFGYMERRFVGEAL